MADTGITAAHIAKYAEIIAAAVEYEIPPDAARRAAERIAAEAVAREREEIAQLAEQDAASADLQVASEEARIAGAVLRNFAARIRKEATDG